MSVNSVKPMFYKITQMRSTIGLPPSVRKNMEALGLKRRHHVKYQKVSPATAHRLIKVKEIVKVELVEEPKTVEELAQERKFDPGYVINKAKAFSTYE